MIVDTIHSSVTDKSSYQSSSPSFKTENDGYDDIRDIATKHFLFDSQCYINEEMSYYYNTVYYENRVVDRDYVRRTKDAVCKKYDQDSYNMSIRDNKIIVSYYAKDSNIKLVDYDVDFDVFNKKHQKRLRGTTWVRLALRDGKIIGEFHKKLT